MVSEEKPKPAGKSVPPPLPEEAAEAMNTVKGLTLPELPKELVDPEGVKDKPFIYPGHHGHPFRGEKIPDLKQTDKNQPQVGYEGHAYVFDLSKQEHVDYYSKLFDMAYNNRAVIGIDRVDYDAKTGKYTAFVRWAWIFSHMKNQSGGLSRG